MRSSMSGGFLRKGVRRPIGWKIGSPISVRLSSPAGLWASVTSWV